MASKEAEIPQQTQQLSSLQLACNRLLASSVGSIVAETLTLPTDVIKTRLQVQNLSTARSSAASSANRVYSGMFNAALQISRHEGIGGLFKGLAPALIRQVSYTGLAFVVFEPVRDTLTNLTQSGAEHKKPGFVVRVMAGGIAGAIGISVMNPTEVLKTKMQTSQGSLYETPSMLKLMQNVYRNDGIVGFWAGVWPNICRSFLVNAAEIGMYDNAKNWIINDFELCADGMWGHISASFVAGVCSACISTPVDVVKTRLMNQAGDSSKEYNKGMIRTLITIPKEEGFRALYKGFYPIICRKVVWCTMFFVTYEKVRVYLGLPPKN